ncbi:MAG: HD domain-containing protein [Bacteroidales bacterium]|nr:HD domain-containing protein [Bacteroidales bacterium]
MDFISASETIIDILRRELKPQLTYHRLEHTLDVCTQADFISQAEGISNHDVILVKTAALLHDIGLIYTYENHEEKGCEIASEILPSFGYMATDILKINGMILSTKLPQNPKNHLEEILCDADLDYLGREDFHMLAHRLHFEWKMLGINNLSLSQWYDLQIRFLGSHQFYTQTAKAKREEIKHRHLVEIKALCTHFQQT